MTLIVFATNLKPAELADEAFLRRIQYKIFAESPTLEEFMRIFENYCRGRDLAFDRSLIEQMLRDYYRPRNIPLRGCHARDLIEHVLSLADYLEQPRSLSYELLEAACTSYFVDDTEAAPAYV
jgi:SpoVK/Ycf46/Vps4 family AAA+-type ATPase